ncbi:hypothetical protein EAF04_005703 [Stromatinia cepivora]|nr:hypothetical protein EAF04_005703 [Stromatinia cepivora]
MNLILFLILILILIKIQAIILNPIWNSVSILKLMINEFETEKIILSNSNNKTKVIIKTKLER